MIEMCTVFVMNTRPNQCVEERHDVTLIESHGDPS